MWWEFIFVSLTIEYKKEIHHPHPFFHLHTMGKFCALHHFIHPLHTLTAVPCWGLKFEGWKSKNLLIFAHSPSQFLTHLLSVVHGTRPNHSWEWIKCSRAPLLLCMREGKISKWKDFCGWLGASLARKWWIINDDIMLYDEIYGSFHCEEMAGESHRDSDVKYLSLQDRKIVKKVNNNSYGASNGTTHFS